MVKIPIGRSGREAVAYGGVYYEGTRVLVNKLDIRDEAKLSAAERYFTDLRIEQGLPREAQQLTYAGFKAIHRHLFQDIYEWAGEERRYTSGRESGPFAPPEQIANWMEKQFQALHKVNFLQGSDPQQFADGIAPIINDINAAHPFIEGNGRTQRLWLRQVAEKAGYDVQFTDRDKQLWYDASRIGFEQADARPMSRLIQVNIKRLPETPTPPKAKQRDYEGPER